MVNPVELNEPYQFEWDEWNIKKNQLKHNVSMDEAEQIFSDPDKKILKDLFHSKREDRYIVVGRTSGKRILYAVFTIRKNRIRVISARDLNRKERSLYS